MKLLSSFLEDDIVDFYLLAFWISSKVEYQLEGIGRTDLEDGSRNFDLIFLACLEVVGVGEEEVVIAARVCYLHGYALDVFLSQELAREVVRRVSLARNVGDEVNLCLPLCEGRCRQLYGVMALVGSEIGSVYLGPSWSVEEEGGEACVALVVYMALPDIGSAVVVVYGLIFFLGRCFHTVALVFLQVDVADGELGVVGIASAVDD